MMTIQSVDRALQILLLVAEKKRTLGEVSMELGITKSAASRLVSTLAKYDLIKREKSFLLLGYRCLDLGRRMEESFRHLDLYKLMVDEINQRTEEGVGLAGVRDYEAIYLYRKESPMPLRIHASSERKVPLHAGASGKVILASFNDEEIRWLMRTMDFKRFTNNTIVSPEVLWQEIEKIRRQGYAISDEEINEGVCGVAVSFANEAGRPLCAISVTGPKFRMQPKLQEIIDILLSYGQMGAV